jgi:glucose dehydrogenase
MVLDVTIYILGLLLLAGGIWLNFGAGWSLTVTGLALLLTAFYNAWVG